MKINRDSVAILLVYIDDIIVTGEDDSEISRLKEIIVVEFELKDLGKLRYFLRFEIARSRTELTLNQRRYTLYLLKEIEKLGCQPVSIPIEANQRLNMAIILLKMKKEGIKDL